MNIRRKRARPRKPIEHNVITVSLCLLAMIVLVSGTLHIIGRFVEAVIMPSMEQTQEQGTEQVEQWETGYVATTNLSVSYFDEEGTRLGTLQRGAQVKYETTPDGKTQILVDDMVVRMREGAYIVSDPTLVVPEHTMYVRTTANLRDVDGKLLDVLAQKGTSVPVTGCDYVSKDGTAHMYRVCVDEQDGYLPPSYLVDNEADALANYDGGNYAIHEDRGNRYGGGGAADLDYYPRKKGAIAGNKMPEECRSLYVVSAQVDNLDDYMAIAANSSINAFVVDITDGTAIGYAGPVMQEYCPSAAAAANNTIEEYKAAIQKLKDAGYYVIGRITTFNDAYFAKDHPEYAITDANGDPLKLAGTYWPTPYSRTAWQYKVDLAVEAVELMGFHEIQFDYVRFPDRTSQYEKAGNLDFHNDYGETKAQAIQRFLMYATDILHEHDVYVSADVFGESAYTYVTAYGQYWPAISNVVDVISGMPYPDHFEASGKWRPWEHPYDTLKTWGERVMARQSETTTPAVVRTWIQAYDAIRKPFNTYGPAEITAQLEGLKDAGCTGGFMTWNGSASLEKYKSLMPAFTSS